MLLTDADQLREALAIALCERDEARAEVERLKADNSVMGNYWSFAAALRDVAERQREACAKALVAIGPCGHPVCDDEDSRHRCTCDESIDGCVGAVRATPLVTGGAHAAD